MIDLKEEQERVEEFMEEHDMQGTTPFRLIDLVSEIGEIAQDAAKSSSYGAEKEQMHIKEDEFGDVLFSLFALANDLDVDLDEAFESALAKYAERIDKKGDPGSR